jgi:DNA-binding transcriptional MerR regulator
VQTDNQILIDELQQADVAAFIEQINQPVFISPDLPISQRMINHWHLKGVFPFQKEAGKRLDFSMVDYMWVLFAMRLRNLGVALPNIVQIKEQCFASVMSLFGDVFYQLATTTEPGEVTGDLKEATNIIQDAGGLAALAKSMESPALRLFSLWLMVAIKNNQDVLVRIQPDEANTTDFVLLSHEATNTEQIVRTIAQKGGLFISIQALLNEFYGSQRFRWESLTVLDIDNEARTIIGLVREQGVKQITITLRDGKAHTAKSEYAQKTLTPTELYNATVSKKYTEWKVVKQAGNALFVQATKSFKFKN